MTDQALKKDETKKNVSALLLSSPLPLTVHELKKDFHTFIGEPIDYKGMGYSCVEDFLRDIQDAVSIQYRNGAMTLTAKADETTKHIQKLVSKQKVTNKKKYAVYRNRGGGGPPRIYQGSSNRCPPRRQPANMTPPQPVVPSYVRSQMLDLFKSFPDGILVTQLDSAFSRMYGTGINYRNFGFQNQYEFLQALRDIVNVELFRDGDYYVVPLEPVTLSRQKQKSKQSTTTTTTHSKCLTSVDNTRSSSVDQRLSVSSQNVSSNQTRPSKGRGRGRKNTGSSCGEPSVGMDARSTGSNTSRDGDFMELEIQQVLEKRPEGIWASRFPYEYTEMHGKALDYRSHGCMSVIDFVASMPDVVRIVRPSPQSDWMLYDARIPDPAAEEKERLRRRHCSGKAMETETKEAIQKILANNPTGISVTHFPDVYFEHTGHHLPISELGFDSAEQLFLSLADSVLQFAYTGNEMLMFSMDAEISDLGLETNTEETEPCQRDIPEQLKDYPSDVVGPGCHYVPVMLPSPLQYVELYVTNVVHPALFWVMLRHKTKSLALEDLMDRLDIAYNKNDLLDPYTMPESLMVPGQVCATLFPEDNNWHRGVITGRNEAGFIEIYYVDYGNTNCVSKSTIRFLKTEFLTLPAQAIQARLANTHPTSGPGGKWKNKSRSRLLELICHRPLIAYVCDIKNQKMSLCLTDTSDPEVDVHINDVIVSEGLAKFIPDEEVETSPEAQKHALEPDYGHVFGWNTTEAPRLPKVAQGHESSRSQTGSDREAAQTPCYVKWIQLTDKHILHLINLDRTAYILSTEISALFWEEDILTSMLMKKRLNISMLVVRSDEYPQLFEELSKYRVKSVNSEGSGKAQFLSLYKLESLPAILQTFEPENEDLLAAVEELIKKFDPDSPYWKRTLHQEEPSEEVNQTDAKVESVVSEQTPEEDLLSIEGKQMALQALQFKRKRILQSMMSSPGSLDDEMVNQLNACEVEIMVIKEQLQKQETKSSFDSSSHHSPEPQTALPDPCSENERVIQNIIASATKPIAAANIMTKPVTKTTTSKPADTSLHSFLSQSGSMPGLAGLPNMAFAQQNLFSPAMFGPAGLSGMGDLSNAMLAGNLNLGAGLNPRLLPQYNPLLFQLPNTSISSMTSQANTNPLGSGIGRGQAFNPSSVGILPGLMPLVQNLSIGRGRGFGPFNNQ